MQNINLEDYKGVYVFAQQVDNELSGIAFELLGYQMVFFHLRIKLATNHT